MTTATPVRRMATGAMCRHLQSLSDKELRSLYRRMCIPLQSVPVAVLSHILAFLDHVYTMEHCTSVSRKFKYACRSLRTALTRVPGKWNSCVYECIVDIPIPDVPRLSIRRVVIYPGLDTDTMKFVAKAFPGVEHLIMMIPFRLIPDSLASVIISLVLLHNDDDVGDFDLRHFKRLQSILLYSNDCCIYNPPVGSLERIIVYSSDGAVPSVELTLDRSHNPTVTIRPSTQRMAWAVMFEIRIDGESVSVTPVSGSFYTGCEFVQRASWDRNISALRAVELIYKDDVSAESAITAISHACPLLQRLYLTADAIIPGKCNIPPAISKLKQLSGLSLDGSHPNASVIEERMHWLRARPSGNGLRMTARDVTFCEYDIWSDNFLE